MGKADHEKIQSHITQWNHNRQFLQCISSQQYPDWIVTVSFYVAVHAVDALLNFDKVSSIHSHDSRNRALMKSQRYEKIWQTYGTLYNLSRTVRYFANRTDWVPQEQLMPNVITNLLYPIERSVEGLIGQKVVNSPISLTT